MPGIVCVLMLRFEVCKGLKRNESVRKISSYIKSPVAKDRLTYINDPVLWLVGIRAANVQSTAVSAHRLNDANVIAAVKVLCV